MRVIAAVIGIIVAVIILVQIGVGQGGVEGCVKECQQDHCTAPGTELMDCSSAEFSKCAQACRTDGG